ncbi:aminopeptidase [Proteiniclasticum sp. QWL-01]|uniref:aminopeptidase n=1 Tax=Proteiniclasticum sp. QWL-01 TaxID=3036945 RepID=UPI00220458D7|nr:aminopeptidase [Proteiniclasticum sp. QWL-01]UUM11554.1 aminopeptidase [Clostridiaceae bacterium HFYG-1003]WFF73027.1 aminopeptidase [Proteiniclasticum sp. QWL-01]
MLEREFTLVWDRYTEGQLKECDSFAKGYIDFLSDAKTEREFVRDSVAAAEAKGFRNVATFESLKAGDKVYAINRDRNIFLFVIGQKPMAEGMNLLGAHIDSPRLDIKQNPLYEDNNLCLMETHYYGGVKKYQWVALPMALHGVIFKEDGTRVDVAIGEDPSDPVIGISDLLIHLSREQMEQTLAKGVKGEDLNVLIGSRPAGKKDDKDRAKKYILELLHEKYGIVEEDFVSAELQIVPAGRARDYGLDRSMVMGYGHDDRVCAYTSMLALFDVENPERTTGCILVDKEEVGSQGATGMHSDFFRHLVADLMELKGEGSARELRQVILNSKMLSSDVSAAFDPNYPSVNEPKNTAYFNRGIVFNKYTGSGGKGGCNDADPEFIAQIRGIMNKNEIAWQTAELGKVDQGGGGTIAYIMGNMGMTVIDAGVAVQNMHAPWEVISKGDLYETYRAYKVFLREMA